MATGASQTQSGRASLAPSMAASRQASRTASPVLSASGADEAAALPLVLCSLLQREFSGGPRSPGRSAAAGGMSGLTSNSFSRRGRRGEAEQDEDLGG